MWYRFLVCLGFLFFFSSCIPTQKTVKREAAMNEWLATVEKPVRVIRQNSNFHCTAGYNCYTLIAQDGQTYYAKNIRMDLPRLIP